MNLKYLPDLVNEIHNKKSIIDDFRNFNFGYQNLIKIINYEHLQFCIGIDEKINYKSEDKKFYLSTNLELLFGFYTTTYIEFDLYLDNTLQNHYILEPNKFVPFTDIFDVKYIIFSINDTKSRFNIRNVKNLEFDQIRFIFLGALLDIIQRKETIDSKLLIIPI